MGKWGRITKHTKYHRTISEKEYYCIANDAGYIHRQTPREVGLPNCALAICNHAGQYSAMQKERKFLLRNYKGVNIIGIGPFAVPIQNEDQ